jgi:ADP-ribosylation factor-like protein 2
VDRFKVNIWDVGGQKSIRTFWRDYCQRTDGLVWVVDSSDPHRLNDCREELRSLLKEERLSGASLLIMANKQDIHGALSPAQIGEYLDIDDIKRNRRCAIVKCSAFDKESLIDSLNWLIHDIGDRLYTLR